jgi:uncharacterized delta-60 repeat protein
MIKSNFLDTFMNSGGSEHFRSCSIAAFFFIGFALCGCVPEEDDSEFSLSNGSGEPVIIGSASNRTSSTSQDEESPDTSIEEVLETPEEASISVLERGYLSITTQWNSNDSVTSGFILLVKEGSETAWLPVDGTEYNQGDLEDGTELLYRGQQSSFVDEGLTDGADYYYTIFAYNQTFSYSSPQTIQSATLVGILDLSFGQDGKFTTNFGIVSSGIAYDIGECGNKYYTFGSSKTDALNTFLTGTILRLNKDGSVDTSWANSGIGGQDIITHSQFRGGVLADDCAVYAVGFVPFGVNFFSVFKLKPDGSPDTTYGRWGGRDGAEGVHSYAEDLFLQGQKVVAVGYERSSPTTSSIMLARFGVDGTKDTTFGGNNTGIAVYQYPDHDNTSAVAVVQESDGGFYVLGETTSGTVGGARDVVILKYTTGGLLDSSFGSGGAFLYVSGYDKRAYDLTIQSNGRIIAVGSAKDSSDNENSLIIAVTSQGQLDLTFGDQGIIEYNWEMANDATADDVYTSVVVTNADALIVAGSNSVSDTDKRSIVARLNADGSFDNSFGAAGNGMLSFYYPGLASSADALIVDSEGNIVTVGNTVTLTNGIWDASWGVSRILH